MSRLAHVVRLGRITAAAELSAVGALMQQVARSRDGGQPRGVLVLARLAGEGNALGRYQAGDYAVGPHGAEGWVRRWTGGHSTVYGDGIVSVTAVLPDPACWLEETGPLPGDRLINRYARGVVRGLGRLGVQASYSGRDFLTVERKRVAYLSAERNEQGVVLFQSVVGIDTVYDPEPEPVAVPGLPPLPPPTALADELDLDELDTELTDAVQDSIAEGFAAQFRLELEEVKLDDDGLPALALDHPAGPDAATLARGKESVIPIGVLEAFASLEPNGALKRVCFAGEWIADSAGVSAFEAALVGLSPEPKGVGALVERFLADPRHFFIGLSSAGPVVEAVLSAARAARARG